MAKGKKPVRHLELGVPVASIESSTFMYEVRGGRWVRDVDKEESECAVIVQERRKGRFGDCRVFRMAIDGAAVETVVAGLLKWLGFVPGCEVCGGSDSADGMLALTEGQPRKACGSGPDRPSVSLSERSELPTGERGTSREPGLRTGSRDS